ncbi:MAG: S41 family peptidase [Lachnospirales bacterium]
MKNNVKVAVGVVLGVVVGSVATVGASSLIPFGPTNINASSSIDAETKIDYIHTLIDENYIFEYSDDELIDSMIDGYVYGLGDPYSTYFNEEEYKKFMESTEGNYVGIGCSVTADPEDGLITVVVPFEDGPAYKAGIKAGDKIISVNGTEVYGSELDVAVSMMKGEEGTEVTVGVLSAETGEEISYTIVRGQIIIDTVEHKMLDNNVGYIEISAFDEVTTEQFIEAYDELNEKNMESLVLDLRNNPGGLLNVVSDIADILVPEGTIVYTEDKAGNQEYIKSDKNQIEIPMVVLVNENSASASEVLAGAIKDYNVGTLVGETTFGKGIVQRLFRLTDGTAVKLTIAEYFTPSGYALHGKGIEPDFVVDVEDEVSYNASSLTLEEDLQLQKALEILSK